jgi:streptomycin 6-kinase
MGLTLGPASEGGRVGFVAPAERADGSQVVLKVSRLDEVETLYEADALVHWHGEGAVRLLDADPDRGALLLERLEPGTFLADHPDRDEAMRASSAALAGRSEG